MGVCFLIISSMHGADAMQNGVCAGLALRFYETEHYLIWTDLGIEDV